MMTSIWIENKYKNYLFEIEIGRKWKYLFSYYVWNYMRKKYQIWTSLHKNEVGSKSIR
jgi:hypothetical protein